MNVKAAGIFVGLAWGLPLAVAGQLVPLGAVEIEGPIAGDEDLSAVQRVENDLVIVSDETGVFQVLEERGPARYRVAETVALAPEDSTELDLEALAFEGRHLYLLGSHSYARRRVRDDRSREENQQRLSTVKFEASRDHLFRWDWRDGLDQAAPSHSLRTLFANHPILRGFMRVPSKENGIDFEGLAVAEGRLFLGLRGPVLRGSYVPILSFPWDAIEDCSEDFAGHPERCRLLFVDLGGLGIRSLHRVTGGFLVVGGPVGDGRARYELFFWNGRDCLPDDGDTACELSVLGEIPVPENGKAEGLAVSRESAGSWEILVVYDGVEGGAPMRFGVSRP